MHGIYAIIGTLLVHVECLIGAPQSGPGINLYSGRLVFFKLPFFVMLSLTLFQHII